MYNKYIFLRLGLAAQPVLVLGPVVGLGFIRLVSFCYFSCFPEPSDLGMGGEGGGIFQGAAKGEGSSELGDVSSAASPVVFHVTALRGVTAIFVFRSPR